MLQPAQAGPGGYPSKPIKIVVPWAAGGAADFLARSVGQRLSERISAPVIVENKAGAATNIGTEAVAQAPADGYTLLMASSNNCVNVSLYPNLRVDFKTAFVPITNVAIAPNILVVHPSVPASNVSQLVTLARQKPGSVNYASSGNGSASHLAAEKFRLQAKVDIVGIPYKGAAPAVSDLLGGQTAMMFTVIPATLEHVKAGKLRAMAVATPKRIALLPDVPTVSESGLPGFESSIWYGLVAPAKTPPEIVQFLTAEISAILKEPAIIERLSSQGTIPVGDSPAEFAATIAGDIERYAELVRRASIKAD
ncbi:MAG: tripartite tricarboxylate transporter substrate binding protein [Burkholderiaceae bacterium]|nr:tripartite tricarboxylate transporter substrate binding protein [Burkholderiaceae bacterium]